MSTSAFSENNKFGLDNGNALESRDDVKSTALSVLYSSNYINGIYMLIVNISFYLINNINIKCKFYILRKRILLVLQGTIDYQ